MSLSIETLALAKKYTDNKVKDIGGSGGDVTELTDRVTKVESNISNIDKEVDDIKTNVDNTTKDIANIKEDIKTANDKITQNSTQINEIKTNISNLSSEIADISKEVDTTQSIIGRNEMSDLKLSNLAEIASSGHFEDFFNIGDSFIDSWSDGNNKYDVQWDFVHTENAILENGTTLPVLYAQWHYSIPFGVQFSPYRAFLQCPDGLLAGTYYFSFDSNWGGNVVKDDIVGFTLTKNVPAGGRLAGCYGAPDQPRTNWRVYVYGADGIELLETVTVTQEATGTNLGVMKSVERQGNLNCYEEMAFGCNRYSQSSIRQWLNSTEEKGKWWKATDGWDIAPKELNSRNGFLFGFSKELLDVMIPVRIRTALNTNTYKDLGTYEDVYDKVFLPSLEQEFINPQLAGVEGNAWDYWKQATGKTSPTPWYKSYADGGHPITYAIDNGTSAQTVRLRSAYRDNACAAWYVGASGTVSNGGFASYSWRCAPACAIGKIK